MTDIDTPAPIRLREDHHFASLTSSHKEFTKKVRNSGIPHTEMIDKIRETLVNYKLPIFLIRYSKEIPNKISFIVRAGGIIDNVYMVTSVSIKFMKGIISCHFTSFLTGKDHFPLSTPDRNVHHMMAKHLLKMNALLKYGAFFIDPCGVPNFGCVGNFDANSDNTLKDLDVFEKWIKINYATTITTVRSNLIRMLYLMKAISFQEYENLLSMHSSYNPKRLTQSYFDCQDKVCARIEQHALRNFKKKPDPVPDEIIREAKKTCPEFKIPFYHFISVVSLEYISKLSSGGYSDIFVIQADLYSGNERYNDKYLVAKVPKKRSKEGGLVEISEMPDKDYLQLIALGEKEKIDKYRINEIRIRNERDILSKPIDKNFPYIAKYYDDRRQNPLIYMEHYMPHNHNAFCQTRLVSIQSHFYWFQQISNFLRYAGENEIVHGDFKSENIVIAKNYNLKVIDFAEAMMKGGTFDATAFNRAITIPFSAPEIMIDHKNSVNASDVFSFSHIINSSMFGKKVFALKRSGHSKLTEKYRKKDYQVLNIKNALNRFGPKFVMKYIYWLVILGLFAEPSYRVHPEDLCVLCNEIMVFCERVY